jgi:hypothetical protein
MKIIARVLLSFLFLLNYTSIFAQCAMCTKTAQQLGEKPAEGLNSGILYLMFAPFIIVGVIGYHWYKNNKAIQAQEEAQIVSNQNIV